MLYLFGFSSIGVVVSDLYFLDPHPGKGQEGAERGVRIEVRMLARGELKGSVYSAQPISVDRPIWRGDLLETVEGPYGSFDRTHHHPTFRGWEPGRRQFVNELSAAPLDWVGSRLSNLDALLAEAAVDGATIDREDAGNLRNAVPEILDAIRKLLDRIHAGELAAAPDGEGLVSARVSWL